MAPQDQNSPLGVVTERYRSFGRGGKGNLRITSIFQPSLKL